ncbi:MAG: 4-hydroxythreonine-4-phosphate dehydrogenase PdxA [Candidatus Omnitrophota bacterium]
MGARGDKIRVGITMGDPSGIGPAIIHKAISSLKGLADFIIIGDKWVFDRTQNSKLRTQNYKFIDLKNVSHKGFKIGVVRAEYGRASLEYLDRATGLIKGKIIDCLVTGPVSKEAISLSGFPGFSGHTEYLAAKAGIKHFVMMLLNKKLKFSLATRHIPLKDVPARLDADKICKTILLTRRYIKELFLIRKPRIAVCGLNPHASDNGLLGQEENKIIKPALTRIAKNIRYIDGPLAADTAILKAIEGRYDCIIAMYHDQALIALKMSGGAHSGVNLTLGLPFIRTSPLHGTAFDIASRSNLASPDSLIEAIRVAVKCTLNQRKD